ncbi:GTP-binding protein [Candidatus Aerophobetes bacterium Ae_b3b]|nr:MAG: GTP-binding protein [Candidatus Aerophobetes bacterium Ae_b3b]
MGKVRHSVGVKLFTGLISGEANLFKEAEKRLSQKFGSVDFKSPILSFQRTHYYESEMGPNLKRKFISFQSLIDPAEIGEIKLFTSQLEQDFLHPETDNRRINLDPGYLTLSKLVLASTKDYRHRIYLGRGIYAEVTLRYKKGKGFEPWEWTYPDYRAREYLEIFNHLRKIYQNQLKTKG